jgi:hypothetical protein
MRIAVMLRVTSMLKGAGMGFALAGILLATPTAARAQSSPAKSAASYFTFPLNGCSIHSR